MKRNSDIEAIKEVAIEFLYIDIEETEFSPIVVMHPIFENGIISVQKNGQLQMLNILENEDNLTLAREMYIERIRTQKSVMGVFMVMRKSYRLTFLKYIKEYLSKEDMSELLAFSWISSENPNQDVNVSLKSIVKWFREADKKVLMDEEEYKYYESLPQTITAYRGVSIGRNPKGLSWTCNLETAKWFANRFNRNGEEGYVQSVTIDKSCVLAYFNGRNEDELVLDILSKDDIEINII